MPALEGKVAGTLPRRCGDELVGVVGTLRSRATPRMTTDADILAEPVDGLAG